MKKKAKKKYRLVIIDDASLKELFSLQLTKAKLYSSFSLLIITLLILVLCVVVYTPARYLVPGYGSYKLRQKYLLLKEKTDSLETKMQANENYIKMLRSTFKKDK